MVVSTELFNTFFNDFGVKKPVCSNWLHILTEPFISINPVYEKFRRDGNTQTTRDSELRHITSLCPTTMVLEENEKVDE